MKKPVIDASPKRIKQIEFGVLTCQDAKQLSVFELFERNLYDLSKPSRPPARYGVLDRRLGTADKRGICETCGEGLQECVGHFGVIRLALPVFHIGYYKLMITILQNICKTCSRVLLEETTRRTYLRRLRNPNLDGVQRKDILKSLNVLCKKTSRCPHCNALNGAVKKVGALKIVHEKFKKRAKTDEEAEFRKTFDTAVKLDPTMKAHIGKAQEDINPLVVLRLFERISQEDCEVMGLDPVRGRPENFLWTALPVPPVCIRPSVGQEASSTEDDLTVLMSEIVEINTKIKGIIQNGIQNTMLIDHWDYLQLQCAMYVTSDLPGIPSHLQSNLQKIKKGFCQRLKGKHGRFRGNLSGKRVDFSGRTVISPDPNLGIDQVAVPERVAKVLTYPERVTAHNIDRLRKNVVNGTEQHPGATYVQTANGFKKFLKYGDRNKMAADLRVGDIVERHLQDGDVVLFNRQPSLHKLSIMAHKVKVRPWRTFRFNECVCTPYNADFDGDEMNLHVPQTEEAKAEALTLMGTKNNLVTPRNGEPLIAATQDFITASYLISKKNCFYDRSQFVQICSYMGDALMDIDIPPPTILKPVKLWTGKQIFGVLMRPNKQSPVKINLETNCRTFEKPTDTNGAKQTLHPCMCNNDGYLIIYNSELMCGVVDKSIIGDGSKRSMFYVALRDYGPDAAAAFMNRVAKMSARWLANQGFSIGIDDVQPGDKLHAEKEKTVEKAYEECDELIAKSKAGLLERQPGSTNEQTLESTISGVLSKVRDSAANKCLKTLNKYNAPLIMSLCGSKGSKINVSQMVACVGQQIISGSRVPDGFGDRSLPHFPKHSKIPAAKGFVRNSFYSGLTPTEFFFHAVSGREGLVDTAVKTAETGYMQRRLMKALEDLTAHYDLSVRNATGGMVQFTYGDDGLDPASMEGDQQPVEFTRNLRHCLAIVPTDGDKFLLPWQIGRLVDRETSAPNWKKVCSEQFMASIKKFIKDELMEKIAKARHDRGLSPELEDPGRDVSDEDADGKESHRYIEAAHVIEFLYLKLLRVFWNSDSGKHVKIQLTKKQLDEFLRVCFSKYAKSKIEPGTAVGAVGAQSIGEPGTQMTLKTFHFAGVASMNVTLGVPRIKEIINASKSISTPIIDATLVQGQNTDADAAVRAARIVKGRIEKTLLEDIMEYMQEVITHNECFLKIKLDVDAIRKLQLEVNLDSIRSSIIKAPKLKIDDANVRYDYPDGVRVVIPNIKGNSQATFHNLQALKRALPKVIVKGIPTVNRAVISGEGTDLKLLVEGYGLREVMGMEGVDGKRTKSNHILEVQKTLGIEAARDTISYEITYTMKSHGMTIDRRHVMLLADLMSYKGEVLGITRFGIAKMKDSVLMLASFEKTTDHLFEASFYGKKDNVDGVSECIIMGVPMGIGTGLFRVVQQLRRMDAIPKPRNLLFDSPTLHVH
ncbi:hypothetical protein HK102_003581 [Quaeritorhiza haematococci]|nr:hypothetical protein HK102_003581 [Quaeritorhiza haematococci]